MSLLYATALLSAGLVFARVLYVGSRLSTSLWWGKEGLMTVMILVIVGAIALGLGFLLETLLAWERQVLGVREVGLVAGTFVATAWIWKLLGRTLPSAVDGAPVPQGSAGLDTPRNGGSAPVVKEQPSPKTPRKAA